MAEMKQTAVEWLIEQLQAPCKGIPSHIIEQSKEMEKQQMKDVLFEKTLRPFKFDFELYYQQTYNKY